MSVLNAVRGAVMGMALFAPVVALGQGTAPVPGELAAQDRRLDRAVSVRVEGIPVGDLLALLAKKTGVELKASREVADDKVVVFSPSRPLRATLTDLAALFNDSWEPIDLANGQKRYLLVRRSKALRYEDGLEQQVVTRMKALLDAQVKALDETPEQTAKRPAKDFIRQNFESRLTHGRQATRLYGQLSQDQKDSLFAQGFLNVSFASSTPTQQIMAREAFGEVLTTLRVLDEAQRAQFPEVHIVMDSPDVLERSGLRFRLTHTNNAGLSAEVLQVILGANTYMTMGRFESKEQWLLPPHGNPYTRKEVAEKAVLPAVDLIRKASEKTTWIDRLQALAESSHCPIFADYFRSPALIHDLQAAPPVADSPTSALDALCRPSGYLWWVGDGLDQTVLLRKRDWYTQRRYEVPDAWMREMARRLARQKSVPTYGDLCQLLDLTPSQISGLNGVLESAPTAGEEALLNLDRQEGVYEMLRLIQAVTDTSLPLPMAVPTQILNRPAQTDGPISPKMIPLLRAFLETLRLPETPDSLRDFSVLLTAYTPEMLKAAQSPPPEHVSIHLDWKIGEGNQILNATQQHWYLWLPLKIPYDRREKTQIEVAAPH